MPDAVRHVAESIGHKCPSCEERASSGAGADEVSRVAASLLGINACPVPVEG